MPSSTFLNLAPEKQEKLLTAAAREFTERPYNEASINQIVQAAGIPRGSFYMYFRDKEDLFRYLIQESMDALLLAFEEILRRSGGDVFAALPEMYDYLQAHREWDRSLGGMGMMAAIANCNGEDRSGGALKFVDTELVLKRMEACVNPDLLDLRQPEDLDAIAAWLAGAPRYYLQNFVDSGNLIGRGYHGFTAEQLQGFAERVRPFFGAVELRGID